MYLRHTILVEREYSALLINHMCQVKSELRSAMDANRQKEKINLLANGWET